jgi:polyketide cyclase/dehydrase/lipid transport protein
MKYRRIVQGACLGAGTATGLLLVARGTLTLDVGIGRRCRPLGPIRVPIAAPREVVFDVIAAPYLGKTPHAMAGKLRVLERGTDMVLAEHFTPTRLGRTTTLETVRFDRPHTVSFRLTRGPVPFVAETFELTPTDTGTDLEYRGELGTDLWSIGAWWGAAVARVWEETVRDSLDRIRHEGERRAHFDRR